MCKTEALEGGRKAYLWAWALTVSVWVLVGSSLKGCIFESHGIRSLSKFWEEGIVPAKKGFKTWNFEMNTCISYFYDHFNEKSFNFIIKSQYLLPTEYTVTCYRDGVLSWATGMCTFRFLHGLRFELRSSCLQCLQIKYFISPGLFFFHRISNILGWPQIPKFQV